MATLLLQAAGAAVGSLFGPLGAIAGRAIGGLAGYAVDQALFGSHTTREGSRLSDLSVQASTEGTPIPRIYGRVRLSGQIIWATRFEEVATETREGSKGGLGGGDTTRTYSYYANFAVGLCVGPVARVGRVWADGQPFDLSTVTARFYAGAADQAADSFIGAKQGDTPAYRDTAMIVFERLPLADFGNRIPQLSFEVIRPVAGLEQDIRAVTLIPGATEFGYDPALVTEVTGPGSSAPMNRHVDGATSDWEAALDELQAVCPNIERVALVVAWFGNDLRASHCTLKPMVVDDGIVTRPDSWRVAGLTRATAPVVSLHDGAPAFGGTPSDATVIRAIQDLTARGIKVTFYPFVMMDVPVGNGLADPYGAAEQGAYPWRGRITLSLAPGVEGSPDKTGDAATEITAFVGSAEPGDFSVSGGQVNYSGPGEWSFRRFVLHCAKLCQVAGGVDAFLLGSELRGLTTVRSATSSYPFVAALADLAADVRGMLGVETTISYGADWSEYFGHQPGDGTGDVHFHLDPLWASDDIDVIGIDNYLPLSDWRDGSDHLDAAEWDSGRDAAYLRANIAAGEYFDWYYASDADRQTQTRTPIADGAYGKPWVFRPKDLVAWWSNEHFDRPGGAESATATAWVPRSKPIWFTELGCPAIDKGPNQPNMFPDAKSIEGGIPYFSTGARDDLVQRRFLSATLAHWNPDDPDFDEAANPTSEIYGGPMVDPAAIHLWTWDARPYPAFPLLADVWSDGANWETGHWLNGRLGTVTADALVAQMADDFGIDVAVADLDGTVDGFAVSGIVSPRDALQPLADVLLFEAVESGDTFRFVRRGRRAMVGFDADDLVEEGDAAIVRIKRAQETELPAELSIAFSDSLADYRATEVTSRRLVGGSRRAESIDTAAAMSHAIAGGLADAILQDRWVGRETVSFALPARSLALEPADVCTLTLDDGERTLLVTRVEDAGLRRIEARTIEPDVLSPVPSAPRALLPRGAEALAAPEVWFLDLPLLTGSETGRAPHVAAFADPWPGTLALALGSAESGFTARQTLARRAVMGTLAASLPAGATSRWDRANTIEVTLYGGGLASEPRLAVLNGANAAAIGTDETGYEIVQFETATLIAANTWRLEGLLRGQAGTEDIAAMGHAAGARFVLLDGAVPELALTEAESGLELTVRVGAAGAVYDPETFTDVTFTPARRGLRCLAPVHLRAARDGDDIVVAWTRRTRIGGDAWETTEVPLGETSEAYRVAIGDGDATLRTIDVATTSAIYGAVDQVADFGTPPADITVVISQVSPTEGAGLAATSELHV